MSHRVPKPDAATLRRVEELLRERLEELGEDVAALPPHEISRHMFCAVHADGSLSYSWRGQPLLNVEPEVRSGGGLFWRFFTHDSPVQ